jgi:hypothetical protein
MKKFGRLQPTSCRSTASPGSLQPIRTPARTAKTSASRRRTSSLDARLPKRPNELVARPLATSALRSTVRGKADSLCSWVLFPSMTYSESGACIVGEQAQDPTQPLSNMVGESLPINKAVTKSKQLSLQRGRASIGSACLRAAG